MLNKMDRVVSILKKIINKIRYCFIPYPYKENIELKTKFGDYKQAVILGSGPSINDLDITGFKDDFVITMGNFYEHPDIEKINPKIHVFAASHPPITEKVLTDWWKRCDEVLPKRTPVLVEKRDSKVALEVFKGRTIYFYSYGGQLPVDFTKNVMSPWSVTVISLQLAIYCRIKKIIMFGINHDWQCLKPYTHFYDHGKPSLEYYIKKEGLTISYEEQKQPYPKERLYKEYQVYQQYESLKEEANGLGLQIYNSDPFSHFDVFPFDKRDDLVIHKNL